MNAPCLSFRCPLRWSDLAGEGSVRDCPALAGEGQGYGNPGTLPGHGAIGLNDIGDGEGVEEIIGAVDRNIFGDAVAELVPELSLLWAESQAYADGQHGKVVVRFTVATTGTVDSVSIQSSELDDAAFHQAIAEVVGGIVLPAGPGTVQVSYPLQFAAAPPPEDLPPEQAEL